MIQSNVVTNWEKGNGRQDGKLEEWLVTVALFFNIIFHVTSAERPVCCCEG